MERFLFFFFLFSFFFLSFFFLFSPVSSLFSPFSLTPPPPLSLQFNGRLKHGDIRRPGWIISKKNTSQLNQLLKKFGESVPEEGKGEGKEGGEEKGEEKKEEKKEEVKKVDVRGKAPFLAQYTTKSIVVFGDSREIKGKLKALKGRVCICVLLLLLFVIGFWSLVLGFWFLVVVVIVVFVDVLFSYSFLSHFFPL